jgi:retron-type reverse transcriptase
MGRASMISRRTWKGISNGYTKRYAHTLICLNQLSDNSFPRVDSRVSFARQVYPLSMDRVCQRALLNRLEPILEPVFDETSFGYRRGRSAKEALRKIWCEVEQGHEGIVDADLKDFFGSAVHEKLMALL